ncbi:ceramide glucosyltransferase [Rhodobacter sp. NTK016B]|uniref:ceramide glucosyltransferase n=1 Tax=Rhodobacter sp. NTK016B TaxID=2759676 RepID=UPI0025710C6B|nr:ceramide glucosyltransferase [Rhodobacter sp. NTK016B]
MPLLLALLAALFLALHLASVALTLHRLRRPRPPRPEIGTPRVTLLRPVCGIDPFDAETLESSFAQDYPDYEIIFCAQTPDDPAIALVRSLIARHPAIPARILIGSDPITSNPKLNNLWKGWQAAESDWICMTDANLLLPRDYLRSVVASWAAGTGLVSSPPVGIRPEGWGGHLECALLNANQARLQLAADSLGHGFTQGKTMFTHRGLIARAGGFAALGRHMAEDATATKMVRGLGLNVRLTPAPFAQPIGYRRLRQVWDRQLRWSRVRRDAFPRLFTLEILNGAALPALMALSAAGPLTALSYLVVWYGAEALLMRRAHWPSGWRDIAVLPLRDAMLPALWLATFARRGFDWRGTAMGSNVEAEAGREPALSPAE